MSSEPKPTSESTEASHAEEPGSQQQGESPEGVDWRAENTRLRQQLKRAQDLNREALPLAQLGVALQQANGGQAIIEKLQKGEDLTAAQEANLEKQAEAAGFSQEQIDELLGKAAQNFEQRLWESRKAERAMEKLHSWAKKEYPGYEETYESPQWNQRLGTV